MEWKISHLPEDYPTAVAWMEARVAGIADGTADECIWLLEHPPLYTAGTSARVEDLLTPARFPVYATGRGGEYTYHGPGQRIVYVMLGIKAHGGDLRQFVWKLEEWIIDTLQEFGIQGERRSGRVGVWLVDKRGEEKKVAALGIRVRRWITYHGISINVCPDLSHYSGIVPCGLRDYGVTSLHALGRHVTYDALDHALQKHMPFKMSVP